MLSHYAMKKRLDHLAQKIEERKLDYDLEYLAFVAEKFSIENQTCAIIFSELFNDGIRGLSKVILIVRDNFPVTVFPRQVNGNFSASALEVDLIIEL